jgi:ABC-type multidrug transport system ATPase subunit
MFRLSRQTTFLLFSLALLLTLPRLATAQSALVEDIEVRGNRRIPRETILYSVQSKPGDLYSESLARRDFESVINLGIFDPLSAKLSVVDGPRGGKIIIFQVKEYPIIRDIEYRNLKSATESEVLTRFKERRVGISKESPFDPLKAHTARAVLREVSFSLYAGEVLAIIGPNGAGKTTLLEAVTGLLRVDSGAVFHSESGVEDKLCFLLDEAELAEEVSVRTLLAHAKSVSGVSSALADSLQRGLELQSLLDAHGRDLSRGERRRVALFSALCTSRKVVVLDEPLGVFDPRQQRRIVQLLKQRSQAGTSLLLSVHQMSDAEKLADRILVLCDGGALSCGTLDDLRKHAGCSLGSLEEVFFALLEQQEGDAHVAS